MEIECDLRLLHLTVIHVIYKLFCFVVDRLEAHNNIWLVGDKKLNENIRSLQLMHNARIRLNKSQLFIYEHFNVKPFYPL